MKNIQLITNDTNHLTNYTDKISINNFNNLKALDDYDINIFNLNSSEIWQNKSTTSNGPTVETKLSSDFKSINKMILNSSKSINIICLPQNLNYFWKHYSESHSLQLKDMIPMFLQQLQQLIPIEKIDLVYENSKTIIGTNEVKASFYINNTECDILTFSNISNKTTTIRKERLIITTLEIINNNYDFLLDYLLKIEVMEKDTQHPEWIYKYNFNDDSTQNNNIEQAKEQIKIQKEIIETANKKLQENLHFKSILYSNSDDLVNVVFEILEYVFEISLSDFNDEKKEDFLFKKDNITYLGEIKGVTSNVKYEHISQLEVHYSKYLDYLQENNLEEKIKKILIINYERTKDVLIRDSINEMQIKLAEKNSTLIIDTKSLLTIYEKLLNGVITKEIVVDYVKNKSGLINFEEIK